MKQTFILFLLLFGYLPATAQYCGLDAPITLPAATDSFVLDFLINDIQNDNLASPDQGVCRVDLFFLHNSIKALNLFLESPNGTRIQLIGPDVAPDATIWTGWDISFVPDAQNAQPDSGFIARWDNNQPTDFGSGFAYTGSYYPYQGKLEDFNSGPVNGTWKLIFKDPNANPIPGRLINFRIVMCDELGQDCCLARSGQLTDPDIRYCEGDPSLVLATQPFYRTKGPDTSAYDYTYVIANYGVLVAFDPNPDLSSYPSGVYTVCGLSYGKGEEGKFPPTDGFWDMNSLRQNLDGLYPLFCGELTDDCIEVTITAASPLTEYFPIICEGETYAVGDSLLSDPGNYLFSFTNDAGCDSLVSIHLAVFPHVQDTLTTSICKGDAVQIGTRQYDQTGYYVDTLQTYVGCDSVVHLFLEVIEPVLDTLSLVICNGDSVSVGNRIFSTADTYDLFLTSAANCDSILTLHLSVLNPTAAITGADIRNCDRPEVLLDAGNSSGNGALGFEWLDANGLVQDTTVQFTALSGGLYGLRVFQQEGGQTCADTAYLNITEDFVYPVVEAGTDALLSCKEPLVTLGSSLTSTGTQLLYQWSSPDFSLSLPPNSPFLTADRAGNYLLIVKNTINGCTSSDSVRVNADTLRPLADAGDPQTLTCALTRLSLDGSASAIGSEYTYQWSSTNGSGIINRNSLNPAVDAPGWYDLLVTNTRNGCIATDSVQVLIDTLRPAFDYDPNYWLNCRERSVVLDAGFTTGAPQFTFRWTTNAQILFGSTTLRPTTERSGNYFLELTYASNSCRDTLAFTVRDTTNAIAAAFQPLSPISCESPVQLLDATPSTFNRDITYLWSSPDGLLPNTLAQTTLAVQQPGRYQLTVLDTFTFCEASIPVDVEIDTFPPVFSFAEPEVLNCAVSEITLETLTDPNKDSLIYTWTGPCISGDPSEKNIVVTCPGIYTLTLTDVFNGCAATQTIEVLADTLLPIANAGAGGIITCSQPVVVLNGSGSTAKDSLRYTWIYENIATVSSAVLEARQAGSYILEVQNLNNQCIARDTVTVDINVQAPVADAGPTQVLNCDTASVTLGGNSSMGAQMRYSWFAIEGEIRAADTLSQISIDTPGRYRLTVQNTLNGCLDTAFALVRGDFTPPLADAGPDKIITCADLTPLLDGSLSQQGDSIRYSWSGPCLKGDPGQVQIPASCEGTYVLTLTNPLNGCVATDTVLLTRDSVVPLAIVPDSLEISCLTGTATIDATLSLGEQVSWFRNGTPLGLSSLQPVVDEPGIYTLVMTNPTLNCSDTAMVVIRQLCDPQLVLSETPEVLTCTQTSISLAPAVSPVPANYLFAWTGPRPGCFVGATDQNTATVTCGGLYRLVVTNPAVGLSDTLEMVVEADQADPEIRIAPADTLTCVRDAIVLDASASESGAHMQFFWTNSNGDTIGTDPVLTVRNPRVYALHLLNTNNGCSSVALTEVAANTRKPGIVFNTDTQPCYQDTFSLIASIFPSGGNYLYQWRGTGIVGSDNQPDILVHQTGWFGLDVTDTANGCTNMDSINIQAPACAPCLTPQAADTLTCARTSVDISASLCYPCTDCTFSWSTNDGLIIAGAATPTATVGQAGTYTLTARNGSGLTTELNILVPANFLAPLADAGPGKLLSCLFEETTLGSNSNPSAPWLNYRWTNAAGQEVSTNAGATGIRQAGWYFLEATDLRNGCSNSDSVLVRIDTLHPNAVLSPPAPLTCTQPLASLDGSASSSSPRIQYTWVRGADTLPASSPVLLTEIAETYTLIVTDAVNGCVDTKTVQLLADTARPQFLPLLPDTLNCDEPTLLIRAGLVNNPAVNFQWCRTDNSSQPCSTGPDILVEQAGTYQVTATLESNGCTQTALLQIAVDTSVPEVVLAPPPALSCDSTSITLRATINFEGNYTSSWTDTNGSILAVNTPNLPTGTPGQYTLQLENPANGCRTSAQTNLTRDVRQPVVSAGRDTFINCYHPVFLPEPQILEFPGGSGIFSWSDAQGTPLGEQPAISAAGMYFLTAKDQRNGCVQQDTIQITARQTPPEAFIASPDGTTLTCKFPGIVLDGNGSTPTSLLYQWLELANAGTSTTIRGAKPLLEVTTPGDYALVVTDQTNGCRDTMAISIQQDVQQPRISLTTPLPITCERTATATDASASDNGANFNFMWFNSLQQPVGNEAQLAGIVLPGNYTLVLENTTNGCKDSAIVIVPIDTLSPQAMVENTGDLDCIQREAWLIADPQNSLDYFYNWTTTNGRITGSSDSLFVRASAAGTYTVKVTNRSNGCFDTASTQVTENATPIDSASLRIQVPDCRNENNGSISIRSVAGGDGPFIYALNNRLFVDVPEFRNLKSGDYTVFVQGANGCEWSTQVVLPGSDRIQVELGPDKQLLRGDSVVLIPQISGQAPATTAWTASDGSLSPTTADQLLVRPSRSTTYFVTLTTAEGCSATDFITVYVQDRPFTYIPDAFSPNGDGINDRFEIFFLPEVESVQQLHIFDRWGNLVFQRSSLSPGDPGLAWDGQFNNRPLQSQVLVYQLSFVLKDGTTFVQEGSFTLIR